jgi:hypothetical protein
MSGYSTHLVTDKGGENGHNHGMDHDHYDLHAKDTWSNQDIVMCIMLIIMVAWLIILTGQVMHSSEPVLKSPCMMIDNLKYCRAP